MSEVQSKGIAVKVAKVMMAVRRLEKDGNNKFDNYHYITGDQVFAVVGREMADAGLVALPTIVEVTTDTVPTKNGSQYRTIVHGQITLADADSGDTWTSDWYGEGTDRGDKSINKAMTAMMKYYLLRLFQIGSGEDADADSPEPPEPAKQTKRDVSRETSTSVAKHRPAREPVYFAPPPAPDLADDVDMGMGESWDNIPSVTETEKAMAELAAGLLHNENVTLSNYATRLIAAAREWHKTSGDKMLSTTNKDGKGAGQYGLLAGKIDALTAKGAHRFILAALVGRDVGKDNPPGWKVKEIIDLLADDAKRPATEQAIKDIWSTLQSVTV